MTTTLRHAWLTPKPTQALRIHVTIKQDGRRGIVWDGTPLVEQIRRDRIAVCFGDNKPAQYYRKDEIEFVKRV